MSEIRFTVYGQAVGKGRPRVVHLPSGKTHTHTPAATRSWEDMIRLQALAHRPPRLLDGPLVAEVTFYVARPTSLPKRVQYPATKPDLDNMAKCIMDALEGIIYVNDSRFVDKALHKRFGDPPRVEVVIRTIEGVST